MRALLTKELRHLMPLLTLFGFVFGMDIFYIPLTNPLDEVTWYEHHAGLRGDGFEAFVLYAMGLTLAFSLFPREYEERTIEFLHTLPVTRWQIFLGKLLAAGAIILTVVGIRELTAAVGQSFNVGSLTCHQFQPGIAGKSMLLGGVTAFLGLAHGLLLSVGRQFGLLLFAFLWWLLSQVEHHAPHLAYLNPTTVVHPTYYGSDLLIPWRALSLHVPLALLCLLLAHQLWAARGHQLTDLIVVQGKRWAKTVGCLTALAVVVLFCLWAATDDDSEEPEVKEAHFPRRETARLETQHYSFTFPTGLRERALRLADRADSLYAKASRQLGGAGKGARVIADLTDVSSEHLGIASTEKLRMDITQNEEPELLQHILFHETCHVLCQRLAGRRGRDYADMLGFFDEGTAEFLAYGAVRSSRNRTHSRRQAVAMKVRHRLTFEEMSDTRTMKVRFDGSLDYTLGELWVAALVDSYGQGSLEKVWKAIGRPNAPKSLAAVPFWQDSLQAAGFNFEVVRSAWLTRLKQLEREEAPFLAALPKLRGRAERDPKEDLIVIQGHSDRAWPKGWPQMLIRIRAENADEAVVLAPESETPPGRVRALVPEEYGDIFEYQFGVQFSVDGYPYWEEWKSVKGL